MAFSTFWLPVRAAGVVLALGATAASAAVVAREAAVLLSDSIREVAREPSSGGRATPRPMIVRSGLTENELKEPMIFEVALKMRNFGELQARINRGELISRAEMAERYFPLASDYQAAEAWIEGLGLTISNRYDDNLSFFVKGSVEKIRDALGVNFARVAYRGAECTSAISAPSVPARLAPSLMGINGLQPAVRLRPHHSPLRPLDSSSDNPPYLPSNIQKAYNAVGLSETGTGEMIGIIGYAFPSTSDMSGYFGSAAASIEYVSVGPGPSEGPALEDEEEITLDAEWAGSMAPGALLRIYGTSEFDPFGGMAFQQVIGDMASQREMHQVSMSYGADESQLSASQMQTDAQYFATMAGGGVTVFFSSGDGGSRPDPSTGGYVATDPIAVEYPASDPSVTAVGGTRLSHSSTAGFSEIVWFGGGEGSGGGASGQFSRPSWQVGEGVPAGSQRLVPDVASSADPQNGAFVLFNGASYITGGTSWSTPTWAGFCALFNQIRIEAALGPVGLLNAKLYPLVGSPSFQDITSGNNGDFDAGPGYDECTGLGTPNVAHLISVLSNGYQPKYPPSIATQPLNATVAAGQGSSFGVTASSVSVVTYQWQALAPGSSTWTNLVPGPGISNPTGAVLGLSGIATSMNGEQFRCVITNQDGTVTSTPAQLTVTLVAPAAPVPSAGPIPDYPGQDLVSIGSFQLSQDPSDNCQWYLDGQPQTNGNSTYFRLDWTGSEAGDYLLTQTNPAGTAVTYQETVFDWSQPGPNIWIDAQQQGSIVYFLFAAPNQILRYDLSVGAWLAPVALGGTPTAFRVSTEGVYVAFGTTAALYSSDFSMSVPLANPGYPTTSIFVNGSYVYFLGNASVESYQRSTGLPVSWYSGNFDTLVTQFDVSGTLSMAFGVDLQGEPNVLSIALNGDGTVDVGSNSPAVSQPVLASRVYVLPGGTQLVDSGGIVYNCADLSYAGSFGLEFNDLCILPDGNPAVVRGDVVTLYASGSFAELGRTQLANGVNRIFAYGGTVTGFSAPATAGGEVGVQQVTEAQLKASPRAPAPIVSGSSVSFIPDDGFVDAKGRLVILSKFYRSLFVWSPSTGGYVQTIPLQGSPQAISYSSTLNRVYLGYGDGRITKIDLGSTTAETAFATLSTGLADFFACDGQLYAHSFGDEGNNDDRYLFDAGGALATVAVGGTYPSQLFWNPSDQSLFSFPTMEYDNVISEYPVASGAFGTPKSGPYSFKGVLVFSTPIRFTADGSLVATPDGSIWNAATLAQTGSLGASFVDAAWVGTSVFTLNLRSDELGSVVQQWGGAGYAPGNSVSLPGYPLRIWPLPDDRLIVMTDFNGSATMSVLDSSGNLESPDGPTFTAEPQGQTSNAGSTVVFSALATGSSDTYQWQFNGVDLVDGPGVSGSNGPQLMLGNVTSAGAGAYSCVVTSPTGTNVSDEADLVVENSATPGFLVNISSRAFVGTGDKILIGGFYIGGSTSRSVLIQALGPALAAEGVSGVLRHPALTIHDSTGKVIYSNTGWGSNPVLLQAAAAAYANPVLTPNSGDSEVLLTLPPGGYTAEVSGADGGTGVALCAVYQLP